MTSNYDAEHKGMLKAALDYFDTSANESEWLPVASWYAGNGFGAYFMPEVGDQVLIAYINGDPHSGIVIASMWNPKNIRPEGVSTEKNTIKKVITKGGHQLFFDDEAEKGGITIKTKKELQLTLLDETEVITIKDKQGKNLIKIDSKNGKIEVAAEKEIFINGGNDAPIRIEGKTATIKAKDITLDAQSGLTLKGQSIKIEGQNVSAKGNSGVTVESSAALTLKGSMTKIN